MRGRKEGQVTMLSLVTPDQRVPKNHPLRRVKVLADEALGALKSFRPKGEKPGDRPPPDDPGNPTVNFHGEARSNETHQSTTDPEAKLARKGNNQPAKLSYLANALMENRNGLLVDLRVEPATGYGERVGALAMIDEHVPDSDGITLGADAGYDTADFVQACRERGITPHVAQTRDKRRRSAVDGRTVRHAGYEVSQRIRKRVEEIFGWTKTVASFRKTRFRGQARTQLAAHLVAAAYNLLRLAKLMPA